jgi:Cytochrome c/c1 heme lyase
MPTNLSQKPLPGQAMPLDTTRVVSSIPTVDESGDTKHWIYPSEQMFFDAMRRKNWNPKEVDMKTVVPIHNAVNERAWSQILEWERNTDNSRYNFRGEMFNLDVVDQDWLNSKVIRRNCHLVLE